MDIGASYTFDKFESIERSQSPDSGIGSSSDDEIFVNVEPFHKLANNLQDELREAFCFTENKDLAKRISKFVSDGKVDSKLLARGKAYSKTSLTDGQVISKCFLIDQKVIPPVLPSASNFGKIVLNKRISVRQRKINEKCYLDLENNLRDVEKSRFGVDLRPYNSTGIGANELYPSYNFIGKHEARTPNNLSCFRENDFSGFKNKFLNLSLINQTIFNYQFPANDPFANFDFSICQKDLPAEANIQIPKDLENVHSSEFSDPQHLCFPDKNLNNNSKNKKSGTKSLRNIIDSIVSIKNGIPLAEDPVMYLLNNDKEDNTDFHSDVAPDAANATGEVETTNSFNNVNQISHKSCLERVMETRCEKKEISRLKNSRNLDELCDKLETLSKLGRVNSNIVKQVQLERDFLSQMRVKIDRIEKGTLELANELDECKRDNCILDRLI